MSIRSIQGINLTFPNHECGTPLDADTLNQIEANQQAYYQMGETVFSQTGGNINGICTPIVGLTDSYSDLAGNPSAGRWRQYQTSDAFFENSGFNKFILYLSYYLFNVDPNLGGTNEVVKNSATGNFIPITQEIFIDYSDSSGTLQRIFDSNVDLPSAGKYNQIGSISKLGDISNPPAGGTANKSGIKITVNNQNSGMVDGTLILIGDGTTNGVCAGVLSCSLKLYQG